MEISPHITSFLKLYHAKMTRVQQKASIYSRFIGSTYSGHTLYTYDTLEYNMLKHFEISRSLFRYTPLSLGLDVKQ